MFVNFVFLLATVFYGISCIYVIGTLFTGVIDAVLFHRNANVRFTVAMCAANRFGMLVPTKMLKQKIFGAFIFLMKKRELCLPLFNMEYCC